ncbi:MAG: methyltransferase [Myxococcota bacterium]|nr:methyltransferase [Myxococcota bacterium]
MRNPIRLKNLNPRFAPFFALGILALVFLQPHPASLASGAAVVLVGCILRGWGAGHLVKNDRLTVTGPYAHLRHPLYAGTLLVGVGFAVIAGGLLAVGLLAMFLPWFFSKYFPRKERVESERLEALYGAPYARYRNEVPALWPNLHGWRPPTDAEPFDDLARTWSGERYVDNNELGTLIALTAGLALFAVRALIGG